MSGAQPARHGIHQVRRVRRRNLAEIQEAIEKLPPEEDAALREWLDESDPDTMEEEYRNEFTFMERQQNDSSMRSNLPVKEFGTLRPNLEKSKPVFAYAVCLVFLTPFIIGSDRWEQFSP